MKLNWSETMKLERHKNIDFLIFECTNIIQNSVKNTEISQCVSLLQQMCANTMTYYEQSEKIQNVAFQDWREGVGKTDIGWNL